MQFLPDIKIASLCFMLLRNLIFNFAVSLCKKPAVFQCKNVYSARDA